MSDIASPSDGELPQNGTLGYLIRMSTETAAEVKQLSERQKGIGQSVGGMREDMRQLRNELDGVRDDVRDVRADLTHRMTRIEAAATAAPVPTTAPAPLPSQDGTQDTDLPRGVRATGAVLGALSLFFAALATLAKALGIG